MDKLDRFILNAGKATQKPEVFYDAFTGKPKELDVTSSTVKIVISTVVVCIFMMVIL